MKPAAQKSITLEEIINVLNGFNLNDARERLYVSKGALINISATVLKVTKRAMIHLQVETSAQRQLEAFAHFTDAEFQEAKNAGVKKGVKITLTGTFTSVGERAVNLTDCQVKEVHIKPKLPKKIKKSKGVKPDAAN